MLFDLQNNESGVKQALEAAINLQAKSHRNTDNDRDLTLTYHPKFADEETIENPSFADLERVVDELWQEAQSIIRGEINSRFTGHFVIEDNQTQDYIQGMWDERFYPAGGFHLEWSCNGNRSWLPLPQSDSETKQVLRLWVEDIQACSALNWELIGDRDPVSLGHPSRRGLKIVRLLKQYAAGERNFRKEDLNNANLFEADLQGINLAQASLVAADLRGANLTRANLTEADLRDSCLIEADLRSANLTGANLEGAIYDEDTEFPAGFDPEAAEMEFYDYEDEDEDEDEDKHYLDTEEEILGLITHLSALETLWLDTEIADWNTSHPRLSLIQVLADSQDMTGASTYILDVLDKPEIVAAFIDRIMINPDIEKVFHNASFDLRYLGKDKAQNVTCTLKIARKIGKSALGTTNLKLKTLAVELCNFPLAEIANEQASDWGKRPLNEAQIKYAKMDVVYLAQLHHQLLNFKPDMPAPPNKSFSVTDVRVAVECPRLFYLSKNFGGKTLFIPQSGVAGIGKTFHKLAEDLITTIKQEPQFQALFKPSANNLKLDAIAPQMRDLFYNLVFFPNYLQPTIQTKPELAPALNQIWQAIGNLIHKWTELLIKNRVHCNFDCLFDNTFVATELKLKHNLALPDGTKGAIAGRLDCLIYDYSKNSLCVVELKTYAPVDSAAQLAQVALYSYMVHQAKQVSVNSAVYCVLPEFKEYFYLWSELETNLHRVIPHKLQQMQQWLQWQPPQPDAPPATSNLQLCNLCPQAQKCQSYFVAISQDNKTAKEKPKPVAKPVVKSSKTQLDPEPIGRELVDILKSFKVNVEYIGAIAGTTFIRIKLKPGRGVKVASILKLAADLQVQLGLTRPPLIATQAGYVSVDLPREDRQTAYFKDYIQPQQTPDSAPITIAIGVDLEGKLVETDLANPNNCHFLVGGTPGSGKSEFLRSLLLSLIYRYSPEQVKITLVDPKRVTFPEFTKMPWLLSPVVKNSEAAISLMEELVAEMDKRYQLLETAGCPHLDAYNQKKALDKQLPRIVCIFDEYADFMVEKGNS